MRLKPFLTVFSFLGILMFAGESTARNGNFYFQEPPGTPHQGSWNILAPGDRPGA